MSVFGGSICIFSREGSCVVEVGSFWGDGVLLTETHIKMRQLVLDYHTLRTPTLNVLCSILTIYALTGE
jgi:hypothetical protein